MEWSAHPIRERGGKAAVGIVTIALIGVLAALLGGGWVWFPVACGVLVVALNRFFFISRFTINTDGIEAKYPLSSKTLRWADIRTFRHDENGAYLTTRPRPSILDTRAMHVLYGTNRGEVLEAIRTARGGA